MHLQSRKGLCAFRYLNTGFTLVEVMTVLVIIIILVMIVYPNYQEAIRKGKRTEGRAALMQLLQQQERYYSQHNSYIKFSFASSDEDEKKFKWFSGETAQSSAYEIKAEPCKDDTIQNCVQLIAKPGTDAVGSNYKDPDCGELTITSSGVKTAKRTDCWK
jgi:type IV pilus assembly protein PilE